LNCLASENFDISILLPFSEDLLQCHSKLKPHGRQLPSAEAADGPVPRLEPKTKASITRLAEIRDLSIRSQHSKQHIATDPHGRGDVDRNLGLASLLGCALTQLPVGANLFQSR